MLVCMVVVFFRILQRQNPYGVNVWWQNIAGVILHDGLPFLA